MPGVAAGVAQSDADLVVADQIVGGDSESAGVAHNAVAADQIVGGDPAGVAQSIGHD